MRHAVRVVLLAGLVVLASASPAAADPPAPGEYRSIIQQVQPSLPVLHVSVLGGDSFLEVSTDRGHELIVYAYSATAPDGKGEPFLRIRADDVVEENQQSPFTYSIQDRFGNVQTPASLNPAGPPQWKQVATGGTYAWHDHRIHWMSPERKPGLKPGDIVQEWTVPMTVDGQDVKVSGDVVLEHPIASWPWFALIILVAGGVILVGRGTSTFVAGLALTLTAAGALVAGIAERSIIPPGAGGSSLVVTLPAVALGAGALALILHRRAIGVVASLLSVATLAGWAIMRFSVLLEPVLPTDLPFSVDRAITAAALGACAGASVLAVRSGGLLPKLPELTDDQPAYAPHAL
jgi:hypothetical protein